MPFNINEFKSAMNRYGGPARKNLFVVEIAGIPSVNTGINVNDIRFFCQNATVPGLNYSVADYYPNGFGVKQTIPLSVQLDQFNAVFMLDSDHMVLKFFHQWMQSVINYNNSNGSFSQINNQLPYEIGYKKDFATTITVKHYSTDSQDYYYEYVLADAFPTQVSGIDVAWADNDSYATVTVNFAYSHIVMSGSKTGSVTERFARGTGTLEMINSIGASGQFINQVNLPRNIQDAINEFTSFNTSISRFNTGVSQIRSGLNNIGSIFE